MEPMNCMLRTSNVPQVSNPVPVLVTEKEKQIFSLHLVCCHQLQKTLYTKSLLLSMFKENGYVPHQLIFYWKIDSTSNTENIIRQSLNMDFYFKQEEILQSVVIIALQIQFNRIVE